MSLDPEVAEVLRRVRDEVLTSPERWTQQCYARNARGESDNLSGESVCWCIEGAVRRVSMLCPIWVTERTLTHLRDLTGVHLPNWNDAPHRTFADVRDLLDRALSEGREEPIHG